MAVIISQASLFDYSEIEVLGDLVRLDLALSGMDDENLMRRLEDRRGHGRDDYPIRVMWNLVVAMKVFEHDKVDSFRRELSRNSQLRKKCGLDDNDSSKKHLVPPSRVFTGFFKMLATEQDEVDRLFASGVNELHELMPEFGENLAGDGKYLDSYSQRKKLDGCEETDMRGEHDAEWSVKEYHYTGSDGKTQTKKEYHYGFKAHIICDVQTELPIMFNVTKANADEKKEMINMIGSMPYNLIERANTLSLDRGYDSTDMIKAIKNADILPIVDIRNCWKDGEVTKQYKDTDMVYDFCGNVFFVEDDGKQYRMKYEGYDKGKKCLRYSHRGKIYKIYISYDERVFLPIARNSKKFARLYKGRTSVERLNGRIDRDFAFEDHCIRGIKKMRMMLSLSLIIMNSMAIAKIKAGQTKGLAAITKGLSKTA
jgi:hypothetical protein